MLKSIELWDFESHEHTVVNNLSDALNLICGESNAGKTSIVRALKLAAYNEFSPKSVRVGKKTCKVLVETDRGKVLVERGKGVNHWEVTKKGCKKETFDSVGVAIVPQAAEVVGLKMVKLGDVEVPVNIMDQLESHFMLSSVGGDKASGSMRAQIVDEISGLSGIEGVIKDVSLDRHRLGREVKRAEDEINDTVAKMHSEDRIKEDELVVEKSQELVQDSEDCVSAAGMMESLFSEYGSVVESVDNLGKELAALPEHERAEKAAKEAEEAFGMDADMCALDDAHKRVSAEIKTLSDKKKELDKLGDPGKQLKDCEEALEMAEKADSLYEEACEAVKQVESREKWIKGLRDPSKAINAAQEALDRAEKASVAMEELSSVQRAISGLEGDLKDVEETAGELDKEKQEILGEVKVCPLTLGPVSGECLEQAGEVK